MVARDASDTPLDIAVVCYAVTVWAFSTVLTALLIVHRNDTMIRAINSLMTLMMALGANMHIMAEIVGNRHLSVLTGLEATSCAFWGYWLPYVLGAGPFFVGLYLRLFTYTTAMSRNMDAVQASAAQKMRLPVAVITMFPIVAAAVMVSITPGATTVLRDGSCRSERGYKLVVGGWAVACMLALVVSIVVFHRALVADVVGEVRKQVFVAIMGVVALAAAVFAVVFAEQGLGDIANRTIATFSISTLYAWALGVMAAVPVWRVLRNDVEYKQLHDQQIAKIAHPLRSVRQIIDEGNDGDAVKLIFADFLAYCSEDTTPLMDRGGGVETSPGDFVGCYSMMDAWTQNQNTTDAELEGFPPLLSGDIMRASTEVVQQYFTRHPTDTSFIDLRIDTSVRDGVTARFASDRGDILLFKDALWWIVDTLDTFYGKHYLNTAILTRGILYNSEVRMMLRDLRLREAKKRLGQASLTSLHPEDHVAAIETSEDSFQDASATVELESVTSSRSGSSDYDEELNPFEETIGGD